MLYDDTGRGRCSRRVDDVKVKKELMGCQLWALVGTLAGVATMASMASMVWMAQGSTDVEVLLVPMMVASMDGVDGQRRCWTGVFDTEGTDVEVPLCPQ